MYSDFYSSLYPEICSYFEHHPRSIERWMRELYRRYIFTLGKFVHKFPEWKFAK